MRYPEFLLRRCIDCSLGHQVFEEKQQQKQQQEKSETEKKVWKFKSTRTTKCLLVA